MTTRKWGGEFKVNTLTAGLQNQSAVTALADGGFMVAWRDENPAIDEIKMQRYDALGNPVAGEFLPFEDANGFSGSNPHLVQLANGGILFISDRNNAGGNVEGQLVSLAGANNQDRFLSIAFGEQRGGGLASLGANGYVGVFVDMTSNGGDIRIDVRDGTGAFVVDNLLVNTNPATLAFSQFSPDVAANAAGTKFAVVWSNGANGIGCRTFNHLGIQIAGEFTVSTPGTLALEPDVAWLDNDRFVVTWEDFNAPPNLDIDGSSGIYYAIYNASGAMIGTQRLANTATLAEQAFPAVTALYDGGFAIAWQDKSQTGGDTSDRAIRLQVFNGLGNPQGAEILVNTTTPGDQDQVALTTLADGRIMVTWTDDGTGDVMGQIIDPRDGSVYGTASGDTLYGHAIVNDEINGLDGADTIFGLGGNDQVHAGAGADDVTLGRGDDVAYGGAGGDTLTGGIGDDVLFGEGGGDTLNSGKGDDELFGGGGNDILIGGLGEDAFNGGAYTDTADYSASTRAVIAALNGGFTNAGDALGDTFTSIENITGSAFNDTLRGTNGANTIIGGNGQDRLEALGGLDTLTGGLGNDTFFINNPNDGADTITDFSSTPGSNDDRFEMRGSNFNGQPVGALLANQFQSSTFDTAQSATVRFFFETDTGNLFWDRDGNAGAFGPVLLATLQPGASVVLGDFTII